MTQIADLVVSTLENDAPAVIKEWLDEAKAGSAAAVRTASGDAAQIVAALAKALRTGADVNAFTDARWAELHGVLSDLSRSRAAQGQSAGDTSVFVLALKKPLLTALQAHIARLDSVQLPALFWELTRLVDSMAQYTVSTFQAARESIIVRQQEELLELSTPVVKLWDGILALPIIGTLDSHRTQIVMETLLQKIVETSSELAIIDITGVPTVDTLVAQHLLKTVTALRLMGADCIISGIRPQIAQTIVHLGIDLQGIATKATLADALALALQKTGWQFSRQH